MTPLAAGRPNNQYMSVLGVRLVDQSDVGSPIKFQTKIETHEANIFFFFVRSRPYSRCQFCEVTRQQLPSARLLTLGHATTDAAVQFLLQSTVPYTTLPAVGHIGLAGGCIYAICEGMVKTGPRDGRPPAAAAVGLLPTY